MKYAVDRIYSRRSSEFKRLLTFVSALTVFATLATVFVWRHAHAATTYTWNQTGTAAYTTSTNWTPTRTTPATTDILVFNNAATTTVTGVPTETIAQLSVSGNTTVNLQGAAAGTILTIGGDVGTDLSVASGSQLNINVATNTTTINVATGATGSISGSMIFTSAAHKLTATDASGITFNSGATFTQGTGESSNVFGSGTTGSIVFASGSTFIQKAGANPFSTAGSVVVFQTGSLFSFQQNSAPSFSGRTYANLEINAATFSQSSTGASALSIDNLTITAGVLNLNLTGGIMIKGNISVASGQTLAFNPASANTLTLGGTSAQTVSNSGTLTFAANESVTVTNTNGVSLNSPLTFAGPITVNSGATLATSATLTANGNVTVNGNFQINQSGFATGSGTWSYGSSAALIFNNSAGSYGVGADVYWPTTNGPPNVNVAGAGGITLNIARTVSGTFQYAAGVNGANNLTLNGTSQVNHGGFVSGSPSYGSASLLKYNTGDVSPAYGRNGEWSAVTSGAGYPASVQISNNTTVDIDDGSVFNTGPSQMSGNLTIDSGSTLTMNAMTQPLNVLGSVTNSGAFILSSVSGGNLNVGGSLTNTGTYTSNGRTLTFNGGAAQTWSGAGQDFGAVTINNTSGGLSLNSAISCQTLTLTSGKVTTTSSNLLTVTNTAANSVSNGSSSSYINGPLARVLPASLASGSTYSFPVGKAGCNPFELVNPTTTSSGPLTLQAEEFDGSSGGTAGTGLASLNTDRYWGGSITSGAANFTNTKVRLTNSSAVPAGDLIGKSSTSNGTYNSIGGTISGATITSDPISSFSFFNIASAPAGNTISGTLFDTTGTPITTGKSITLLIDGGSPTTVPSDGTGVFTFTNVTYSSGAILTVYVDGADPVKGATVTRGSTGDITNLHITQNQLTVRHQDAGPITNANLNTGNPGTDTDLTAVYTVPSGVLTTSAGQSITIFGGSTFAPGANVIDGGDWINNGTFTAGANTVTLNGTANQTIGGANNSFFNNLTINNSGTSPNNVVSQAIDTNVGGVLTISGGVFDQGASFSLFTTGSATNVVSVGATGTWRNIGTGDLTLSGGVSNLGSITFNGGGTSCGDADTIVIRSSLNGTQRTWSGSGTFSMIDVDVKDQKVPAVPPPAFILVNSGTDSTNNSGWVFVNQCTSGTYTWIGGTTGAATDWTIPTNWNPTRVTPAVGDNLIFDGNSTPSPTVTNVPTQTIATLSLVNNFIAVTLQAPGANTLTLAGATGHDLSIPAGTSLTVSGANALTIALPAGSAANVDGSTSGVRGSIALLQAAHRLTGQDAGSIVFKSGSIFTSGSVVTTGFTGNPFGAGTNGSVILDSGSSAFLNEGGDLFGGSGHSVTTCNLGSTQTFSAPSAFSSDGRSYGNLILENAQNYSGSGSGVLTVQNDLTIKVGSALTLSGTSGGDLNLLGNFTDQDPFAGNFNANGRTVKFQGGSNIQTVGKSSVAESFGAVSISKTGGTVQLTGSVGLTINGALQFQGSSSAVDVLEFGAKKLTLNGTFTDSSGSAANGFKGDLTGSSLVIGGTGALGTLDFVGGGQTLSSLTMNRTSSGSATLGTNLTIGSSLTLTNGIVNVGVNTLSLGSSTTVSRTSGYVIGNVQKSFGASGNLGNFTFPVGTANAYSPLDANVTANTNGTLTAKAVQGPQPNISGPNALQRFWTLSGSGLTANLTFHYSTVSPNDVVGTEANYQIFKYNGGFTQFTPDSTGSNSPQDHFATLNNVSSFSDWTLAEAAAVSPPTLVVNTTDDQNFGSCQPSPGHCSLREAINVANGNSDLTTITFAIPAADPGHVYYKNDNSGSHVTNDVVHLGTTSATDDTTISDIDPDWPHSWWVIKPLTALPAITEQVIIDGYSQTGASVNDQVATDNAVLRIELNGASASGTVDGFQVSAPTLLEGLAVNRFTGNGVSLLAGSDGSAVTGNFIGTDVSGTLAEANSLAGVSIHLTTLNGVGCTVADERNIISGNTGEGVELLGASSNFVQGNFIGVAANGASLLGNGGVGVEVYTAPTPVVTQSTDNTIGVQPVLSVTRRRQEVTNGFGCRAGKAFSASANSTNKSPSTVSTSGANIIAGNGSDGVRVTNINDVGNSISQNSIFSNGKLGINLVGGTENGSGVTANDPGDGDSGPNDLQNFPVITNAVAGNTTVSGTLDSISGDNFTIEIFANDACDASGNGEGKTFVGSAQAVESATPGQYNFDVAVANALVNGHTLTATAIRNAGDTSEFSECFAVTSSTQSTATAITNATSLSTTSSTFNAPFTVQWSVTPATGGTPTGNVTVSVASSTDSCTAAVSAGQCDITPSSAGTKQLTATYAGDSNFSGSSSTPAVSHVVDKASTTTSITNGSALSTTPSDVGQSFTVQWSVTSTPSGASGTVSVTVDGNPGCSAAISAGQCDVSPSTSGVKSVVAHYGGDGNFLSSDSSSVNHTVNPPSISGHVSYCITPSANVPGVTMNVTGSQTTSTATNSNGDYSISLTEGGNYTLTPSKTALSAGASGINTIDVIAAQRHFLGAATLSGCALTAADANEDSTVDTIDVIAIQQFYLGKNSGTANVGQWRFSPASQTYPSLAADHSSQNYSALTLGDINGDLTPTRANPDPGDTSSSGLVRPSAVATVSLPVANVGTNVTNFTLPVTTSTINASDNLIGFQGDFTFDSSVVTFQATPASPAGLTATNWNVTANVMGAGTTKTLRISAFSTDSTPLSGSGTLFNLNFTRVSSVQGANTALAWAAPPNNFLFIDSSLNSQAPGSTPAGSITIVAPTASPGDVSGRIIDANGNPVEGVAMRLSGTENRLVVSDAQGNYRFDNVDTNGFYTVTPSRANFAFTPAQRSFSQLGLHTAAAFNAAANGDALNPLDRSEYFIRQQYLDFLNREPDEAGLNFWFNNIEVCGADDECREAKRIDTSAAFFLSTEFQQTGYLVYRTYAAAFGDLGYAPLPLNLNEFKPDTVAIGNGVVVNQSGWQQLLEHNTQAYMSDFVQRARFADAYPNTMTPAEFVDRLFANAGVHPASNDRAAAINEFGAAASSNDRTARARALRTVAENATLLRQDFDSAFVLMQYFGYLRRNPNDPPDQDFSGYSFWLTKLDTFQGNFQQAEMVRAFLLSSEYRGRFPR